MLDACNVVTQDGHSTHATRREAVINSAISQDVKPCLLCSIAVDWCLLCVWATKICHFDSLHQYTTRARGAVQE